MFTFILSRFVTLEGLEYELNNGIMGANSTIVMLYVIAAGVIAILTCIGEDMISEYLLSKPQSFVEVVRKLILIDLVIFNFALSLISLLFSVAIIGQVPTFIKNICDSYKTKNKKSKRKSNNYISLQELEIVEMRRLENFLNSYKN